MYCVCDVRARQSDRHARFDGGPVVPASRISHAVEPYRGTREVIQKGESRNFPQPRDLIARTTPFGDIDAPQIIGLRSVALSEACASHG